MSDLMCFYTVTTSVPAALALNTPRATNTPNHIVLDRGMAARIWSLQIEGVVAGVGKIALQYCLNIGGAPEVWQTFKGFSKLLGTRPARWKYTARPLVIEALNNTTGIRLFEEAGTDANLEVSVNIEFGEMIDENQEKGE